MLEIEVKVKVDSHGAVRERLRRAGGEYVCRMTEVNTILDTPDRRLFGAGCGLRVRTCRGEGRVPGPTLTYKGPQHPGTVKIREEVETEVHDAEATVQLLNALGFVPAIVFEKRRESWRLDGAMVELDELPRLGCYVEIEADDEAIIQRVRETIGLSSEPTVTANYIALLIEHARANGLPFDHITFC
jgi:predicted adenylyl cyclase CyaB